MVKGNKSHVDVIVSTIIYIIFLKDFAAVEHFKVGKIIEFCVISQILAPKRGGEKKSQETEFNQAVISNNATPRTHSLNNKKKVVSYSDECRLLFMRTKLFVKISNKYST